MLHQDLDAELYSALVHTVEEGRPWQALYALAERRDTLRGLFVPQTEWHEWLERIESVAERLRIAPQDVTGDDLLTWRSLESVAPFEVEDTEVDEVSYGIRVRERLHAYLALRVPPYPDDEVALE